MTKSIHKLAALIIMLMIIVLWTMPAKAQIARFCLDTIQGGKVKFCSSQYTSVVIYKLSAAQTGRRWTWEYPIHDNVFDVDSIVLTSVNNG